MEKHILELVKLLQGAKKEIDANAPGLSVYTIKLYLADPLMSQVLMQLASKNPEIGTLLQQITDMEIESEKTGGKLAYIHQLRCGGKPKKKACGGKMKATVKAEKGCKCKLARLGDKLINIDCVGHIIK